MRSTSSRSSRPRRWRRSSICSSRHRQRAAAEAAERAQNTAVAQAAAAKATTFLQKARGVPDPIFGLIADDLERVPFVYVRPGRLARLTRRREAGSR